MKTWLHSALLITIASIETAPTSIAQESEPAIINASDAIISKREEIKSIEDSSVAEAVERRPELQFNNITIDGEKANISLSEIPAEAVSSIEVLRAITPDLDADARGGALSLESKPTFEIERRISKGEIRFDYEDETGSWEKLATYTFGKAIGDFGFRITTKVRDRQNYEESIRMDWQRGEREGNEIFTPRYVYYRHSHEDYQQYSLSSRFDYRISDPLRFFLRADISRSDFEEYQPRLRYRFDSGKHQELNNQNGSTRGAKIERDLLGFESTDDDYLLQFGGEYESNRWKMDLKISQESSDYVEPDWFIIEFTQEDVDLNYQWDDPRFPRISSHSGKRTDQPTEFQFDELLSERWANKQTDAIAVTNLKYNFEYSNLKGYLKAGVKRRGRTKDQSSDSQVYTDYTGNYTLADTLREDYQQISLLEVGRDFGPFPSLSESREFLRNQSNEFPLDIRRTREHSDPITYEVSEDISSAFLMLNLEKGNNRGIIGIRLEKTELEYQANEVIIDQNGEYAETRSTFGSNSYQDIFPSVHYRRFLGPKTTFIASWTGTIKRPFYGSIVPFRHIDYDDQEIESGNPGLKPTQYDNIDLSIDYKLSERSTLSIEAYHRDVTDIVFEEVTTIAEGPFLGFEHERNANGPNAKRKGVKLIWSQALSDWSKHFEGFSFNLKTSMEDSETVYPNRPGTILPVTNSPETKHQISLTYESDKTYLQLVYKYQSESLDAVDSNAWHDRYSSDRSELEVSTSYQLNATTRLFLNIENGLRAPYERYYGSPSRLSRHSLGFRKFSFGAKLKF